MSPKVLVVDVMVPDDIELDGDRVDYVDAKNLRPGDSAARKHKFDVPLAEADRPISGRARVGHREGQAVAGLGHRHRVDVALAVFEGRADGRRQEVGRTRRPGRPGKGAGEGVTLRDGYLISAAHRVLTLPRLEGGGQKAVSLPMEVMGSSGVVLPVFWDPVSKKVEVRA